MTEKMKGTGKYAFAALFFAVLLVSAASSTSLAGQSSEGWVGPYPPLSVVYEEIETLKKNYPDLVEVEEIGKSVRGRPIYAVRVARRDGESRPEALITGNIHACEVLSSRVAIAVATRLVESDGRDEWITSLLDRIDFWIIPIINPDGYYEAINRGGRALRKNANGVDLNRNFPVAPGAKSRHPFSGNRRKRSNYYMGPSALSEPETRAIAEFVKRHNFFVSVNGHTVAGKFLYPHGHTKIPAAHSELFIEMGQTFIENQGERKYVVQISSSWYPTLGDLDDFLYMEHGVMSITVEYGKVGHNLKYALLHPKGFWIANPKDADAWVENDRDAVLAAIEAALEITAGKPFDPSTCRPVEPLQ